MAVSAESIRKERNFSTTGVNAKAFTLEYTEYTERDGENGIIQKIKQVVISESYTRFQGAITLITSFQCIPRLEEFGK